MVVAAAVEGAPLATPPSSPAIGACYLVAASPTGAFAGHAQHVAAWTSGGWRFIAPVDGMSAFQRVSQATAVFHGGAWEIGTLNGAQVKIDGVKVIGARGAAIAAPAGGGTVDAEARAAIGVILGALRAHGLIDT